MIRFARTSADGTATEVLTLCRITSGPGRGKYVGQVTTGPDMGDDFVCLFDIHAADDLASLPIVGRTWEAVETAPLAAIEALAQWDLAGTCVVERLPEDAEALAALRTLRPAGWRRVVRSALRAAGTVAGAARVLGVDRRSLERWIAEVPALAEGIDLPGRGRPKRAKG